MNRIYLSLVSFASLLLLENGYAADPSKTEAPAPQAAAGDKPVSSFTAAQIKEIKALIEDHLLKNPEVIMFSFQAGMEKQQQEKVAEMEKAVKANAEKLFRDKDSPVVGNEKGSQSLVVFLDPNCGYCKKLELEIPALLKSNKDLKVIYKNIPIMGDPSVIAVKAMFAAKEQGKYEKFQNALFASEKRLTKKEIFNIARAVGLNTKKLQADMKKKSVQDQVDQNLALAKALGIDATPMLIIGEVKVVPGYMSKDDIVKALKEVSANPPKTKDEAKKDS